MQSMQVLTLVNLYTMQIKLKVFGQLSDIVTVNEITLHGVDDTEGLVKELNKLYPALIDKTYFLAIDNKTILGNTILKESSMVALMPPFSGG